MKKLILVISIALTTLVAIPAQAQATASTKIEVVKSSDPFGVTEEDRIANWVYLGYGLYSLEVGPNVMAMKCGVGRLISVFCKEHPALELVSVNPAEMLIVGHEIQITAYHIVFRLKKDEK